ncbi:formate dehydrogenase accessory sulfurtransferase FdhD [Pigmentiphaga soli]|uniref:Sulfur carrier protein FdhD n=1 Tax=Pigmentiphaga soli TaxID=1007095 RepID=A0ABP8H8F9_9BURK
MKPSDFPPDSSLPTGARLVEATRHTGGGNTAEAVAIAEEVPIALVFNGISHAVMMATPADLEHFALGFALSEGIIDDAAACRDMQLVSRGDAGTEVQMEIGSREFARLKERRRSLAGRTGCGLCGVDSLVALELDAGTVRRPDWSRRLGFDAITAGMAAMSSRQALNARTGGVHAAAWLLPDGSAVHVAEDVGRHNALDKLLGWLALQRRAGDAPEGFAAVSSRASFELVRKCARLDVPALAAISAPTALAVQLARQSGMALLAFCRPAGMTLFAA